jgi:hypothetical protein
MSRIKYFFKGVPTDAAALEELAREFGVSLSSTSTEHFETYEVQRRIREAISDLKTSWLWLIAVASAIASVFSALAAWMAVWSN